MVTITWSGYDAESSLTLYYYIIPNYVCYANLVLNAGCNVLFWGRLHSLSIWKLTLFPLLFYSGQNSKVSTGSAWARGLVCLTEHWDSAGWSLWFLLHLGCKKVYEQFYACSTVLCISCKGVRLIQFMVLVFKLNWICRYELVRDMSADKRLILPSLRDFTVTLLANVSPT